jgi:hypothetical protein
MAKPYSDSIQTVGTRCAHANAGAGVAMQKYERKNNENG